ncbi:hypothetical protein KJ673_00325 [Patescibacteria group bacterium]|nr:hypothetical protein [Patescibacteria group bacterium]
MNDIELPSASHQEKEYEEPTPEVIEQERKIVNREIKDANGEVVCTTEVETRNNPEYPEGQEVVRYELVSPSGERVNLLERVGITNEVVLQQRGENYFCRPGNEERRSVLLIPPAESTVDIATALHEMGHAAQSRDQKMVGIDYGLQYILSDDSKDSTQRWLQMAWRLKDKKNKRGLELLDGGILDQFDQKDLELFRTEKEKAQLAKERDETYEKAMRFKSFMEDGEKRGDKDKQNFFLGLLQEEIKRLDVIREKEMFLLDREAEVKKDITKLIAEYGSVMKEEAAAGTKVLERDATARALKWMRKIQQEHGINLFASQNQEATVAEARGIRSSAQAKGMRIEEHPLLSQCDEGKTNAYDVLKTSLGTYHAERSAKYHIGKDSADVQDARALAEQVSI